MAGKKLSAKDLEYFKNLLLVLRDKAEGDVGSMGKDCLRKSPKESSGDLSSASFHMADMASDLYATDFNLELLENEQDLIAEIDSALKRIEDGTYGICEKYGTPISKQRLKVVPYAKFSKKAQEEEEKRK